MIENKAKTVLSSESLDSSETTTLLAASAVGGVIIPKFGNDLRKAIER